MGASNTLKMLARGDIEASRGIETVRFPADKFVLITDEDDALFCPGVSDEPSEGLVQSMRNGWLSGSVVICVNRGPRNGVPIPVVVAGRSRIKAALKVNLERALKLGDELGGHLVSGHVDGVAEVISATPENASVRWRFRAPEALAPFIASKGSVALDGVSLTVNEVDGATFGVNIIPHTAAMTGFGTLQPGDRVNIEIDTLARYVARMMEFRA
jgi:hypothetical protein